MLPHELRPESSTIWWDWWSTGDLDPRLLEFSKQARLPIDTANCVRALTMEAIQHFVQGLNKPLEIRLQFATAAAEKVLVKRREDDKGELIAKRMKWALGKHESSGRDVEAICRSAYRCRNNLAHGTMSSIDSSNRRRLLQCEEPEPALFIRLVAELLRGLLVHGSAYHSKAQLLKELKQHGEASGEGLLRRCWGLLRTSNQKVPRTSS